jgi:hypothetical protein
VSPLPPQDETVERAWERVNDLVTRAKHMIPGLRVAQDGTRGLSIRFSHPKSPTTVFVTRHRGLFEIASNTSRGLRRVREPGEAAQTVEIALMGRGLGGLACCPRPRRRAR